MKRTIVIGAGQAGASLVAKLRFLGHSDEMILIGGEPLPPYQRPPLTKSYLLGEKQIDNLLLRPPGFYADHNVQLRLGEYVEAINPFARVINIGDETLEYDRLVLTTGSIPRRLPSPVNARLEGVYVVRTLADADAMIPEFRSGRSVLIIGGGYIGLEAAAIAATLGLKVTLVEVAARILQRVASPETSGFIRRLHESHGVRILEGVGLKNLINSGARASGAVLTDGQELPLDFVIVGLGIEPATALAEAAGLKIENGVWTDSYGRTSDPSIWAAGDCASFPWKGGRLRLESVGHAIDHAECVAYNIMGIETVYEAKPWFWSDQYDVKLQIAGLNTGYDRVVVRKGNAADCSVWYYRGEQLLAVDAINDPRAYMAAKRIIDVGQTVDGRLVQDPQVDVKQLMASATTI